MKNSIRSPFYNPLTPEEDVLSLIREWFEMEKKGDVNAFKWVSHKMKKYLVKTDDGTYTLRSNEFNSSFETMHTSSGAYLEAKEKFVNPAGFQGKKKITILDICSGLGFNSAAALEIILNSAQRVVDEIEIDDVEKEIGVEIEIDMVEISLETLAASLIIPSPSDSHAVIKKAIENYLITHEHLKFPQEDKKIPHNVEISVYCKDAREMVTELPPNKKYDAIFLDPFSPAKSPELYSYDFLLKLSSLLKSDGLILTYTAAAPVRYSLINIGLHVGEGPAMGRSGGTIASYDLNKVSKSLSENDERMIALSDAGIPYKDPELTDNGNEISKRRQKERIALRGKYKMASTVKTPIYLARNIDDERTKRRVLNHLKIFGIDDLNSKKARFLVCPQFNQCICNCKGERPSNSRERVKEMEKRLNSITIVI